MELLRRSRGTGGKWNSGKGYEYKFRNKILNDIKKLIHERAGEQIWIAREKTHCYTFRRADNIGLLAIEFSIDKE